jgi:MFS family permease
MRDFFTHHASRITHHASRITHHASRITYHASRITHPSSRRQRRLFAFTVFVVLASLDNAAAGVLPPLYAIIARDLATAEAALGFVTAVYVLIVATAATIWGYQGDSGRRKPLLLYGTVLWGAGMILTATAPTFLHFLLFQMVTAVGVGAISSVGFSVISDLIPARRRGLALSLWSVSQGLGGAFGALLGSTLGAYNWRWPFFLIAALGFFFALLYLFTEEPRRGRAEPELAPIFAAGKSYSHRITFADIRSILARRSNAWLLWQSFFFSLAYGSTVWVPRWAIARVQVEGYGLEIATIVGNLFVALFSVGAFFSIAAGHWGDRWQRRNPRGRTILSTVGLLGSIPFFVVLFFIPFKGIVIPPGDNLLEIGWAVLAALFTNPWVIAAFLVALFALALQATDPPNWAALITDVNLPEHRGTIIGLSRLFRAAGNAISVGLTGVVFAVLSTDLAPPDNYAVGLALFQILVIPAGLCYLGASRVIPHDIARVRQTLLDRAAPYVEQEEQV